MCCKNLNAFAIARSLCSSLTESTKSTLPIIDSLIVPTGRTGSERLLSSLKVYSGFNVGRIPAGSLQPMLVGLAHPLPKESSPERQEPTLRMAERFHAKTRHLLSAAPYTIRNKTDATAIIRRHSPRGGVLRRAAYEPTCSRSEHRPCVDCRHPSQVCWFPQSTPSHVSRETKAHPFHTGLDRRSASYVLVDTAVGPRHILPGPHRCTHLRRGLLLIEGRTWC